MLPDAIYAPVVSAKGNERIIADNNVEQFRKFIRELNYKYQIRQVDLADKGVNAPITRKYKKITEDVYIITASADFYCKYLARLFDVKLISTKVNLHKKNFGQLVGKNCFGNEKKLRVLSTIKNFKKKYSFFFTDSKSDLPLLRICNKGYYV
jgi:phosphoserine phosphatase